MGWKIGLATDPMTIREGRRAIAQAVTDCGVKARGPGCPHVNLLAKQPFWFDPPNGSPLKNVSGDGGSDCQPSPHWPSRGQECNRCQRDQRPPSPQFPSPSPDCGFESNQSSLSMASLMLSRSNRSDGSQHPRRGRWHQEDAAHMIILPIFKDKDAKDAVTYQSWRWDLMVYQCAWCRDHTLLPYAIRSLQGYPGELVWSSGVDIALDDVLTILDEHYNNVKALDALNQELQNQTTNGPPKPRTTSFFPLRKLKGNQPLLKKPAVCLAHLEEEDAGNDEDKESDNPST